MSEDKRSTVFAGVGFIRPQIEPYFHEGIGITIRSKKHLRDELKARGLIEVGTEKATQVKNTRISDPDRIRWEQKRNGR